jgi:putative hydrolase of HD superfamily
VEYALIHDLGELYAGDTYTYDEKATETKAERERESMDTFLSHLPPKARKRLSKRFHDYENKADDEAKFIYELDKIQPVVLIQALESRAQKDYGLTKQRVLDLKLPKFSDRFGLKEFFLHCVEEADKSGTFAKEPQA